MLTDATEASATPARPDTRARSAQLFEQALELLPGGVDSPVRAFKAVGGSPIFAESGAGAWLTDVDGNRYLDLVPSHVPRPVEQW